MNGNMQNGGLIHRAGTSLLVTDLRHYSGTLLIHNDTSFDTFTDSLMWFMSEDGQGTLYSDQRGGNRLCRYRPDSRREEVLLDKPVMLPTLVGGRIYYIDETDRCLYACDLGGGADRRLSDERVYSFLPMEDGTVLYSSAQGIRRADAGFGRPETIAEASAGALIRAGGRIAYADRERELALTLLDLSGGQPEPMDAIAASSINTDGRYLYCANRRHGSSLYRVDPLSGASIRISGDSADYLHVLEDDIYFISNREWFRLPLSGGEAELLIKRGGTGHEYGI